MENALAIYVNNTRHFIERGEYYHIEFCSTMSSTSRIFVMEFGSIDYIISQNGMMYPPGHYRRVYDVQNDLIRDIMDYQMTGIPLHHINKLVKCTNLAILRAMMIDAAIEI